MGALLIIFISIFFLCAFNIVKPPTTLYFNSSPSLPMGFYLKVSDETSLKAGDLVILKVPKAMNPYVYGRHWLKEGAPLLKTVYALPGDTYVINNEAVFVNGEYIGEIFDEDSSGLPLPKIRGSFTVKEGYFLPIAARFPNSFDGRYFGEVSKKFIIARVKPLFILPAWVEELF